MVKFFLFISSLFFCLASSAEELTRLPKVIQQNKEAKHSLSQYWYIKRAFPEEKVSINKFSVEILDAYIPRVAFIQEGEKNYLSSYDLYYYLDAEEAYPFQTTALSKDQIIQFRSQPNCQLKFYRDSQILAEGQGLINLRGDQLNGAKQSFCLHVVGQPNYGLYSNHAYRNDSKLLLETGESLSFSEQDKIRLLKAPYRIGFSFELSKNELQFSYLLDRSHFASKIQLNGQDLSSLEIPKNLLKKGLNTIQYTSSRKPEIPLDDIRLIPCREVISEFTKDLKLGEALHIKNYQTRSTIYANQQVVGQVRSLDEAITIGNLREGSNSIKIRSLLLKDEAKVYDISVRPQSASKTVPLLASTALQGSIQTQEESSFLCKNSSKVQVSSLRFFLKEKIKHGLYLNFFHPQQHSLWQWRQKKFHLPQSVTLNNGPAVELTKSHLKLPSAELKKGWNHIKVQCPAGTVPLPTLETTLTKQFFSKSL